MSIRSSRIPSSHRVARAVTKMGFRRSRDVWRVVDRMSPRPSSPIIPLVGDIGVPLPHTDVVADDLYRGYFERGYLAYLRALVDVGDTAIDVGANIGAYTLALAHMVGRSGEVIAFEPVPALEQALRDAIRMNELNNVRLVRAAVGSRPGIADLHSFDEPANRGVASLAPASARGRSIPVEVTTLDEAVDQPVSFLKIDVEGFETEVLRGAERLLAAPSLRAILVEFLGSDRVIRAELSDTLAPFAIGWEVYETTWHKRLVRSIPVLRPTRFADLATLDYNCNLVVVRRAATARIAPFVAPRQLRVGIA
jgi:FkbM family methyltransferase